jgi:osmoprotectant transport system substrate-binding protein
MIILSGKMKGIFAAIAILTAVSCLVAGFASAAAKPKLVIGSKDFTESILISEIFAQALENGGFVVDRKQALGGTAIIQAAMTAGDVDLYPEYTSTALVTVLKEAPDFDPKSSHAKVKAGYAEKFDLAALDMAPLNNSQGVAITKEAAEKYGVRTLTDLSKAAPDLRLCSTPEFEERPDGLAGLKERLGGFEFKSVRVFDKGIKYEVLRNGEADVNVCFTTDAHLAKGDIVAVEDDISFWPPYNMVPIAREDALEASPEIAAILNPISAALDSATMQALNARVDLDGKEYGEVAGDFLRSKGFIE